MGIKEIRMLTGLSQVGFAKCYGIPVSTLKKWETDKKSKNHRECPEYVTRLLEIAVKRDMAQNKVQMLKGDFMTAENNEYNRALKQTTASMAIEDMYFDKKFLNEMMQVSEGKKTTAEIREEVIRKYGR